MCCPNHTAMVLARLGNIKISKTNVHEKRTKLCREMLQALGTRSLV